MQCYKFLELHTESIPATVPALQQGLLINLQVINAESNQPKSTVSSNIPLGALALARLIHSNQSVVTAILSAGLNERVPSGRLFAALN